MPQLQPLILVGGLPRAGKSTFTRKFLRKNPSFSGFQLEDYLRQKINPSEDYRDAYQKHCAYLRRNGEWNMPLYNEFARQQSFDAREFSLEYDDHAENLLMQAMIKDVAQATYERKPVIADSNFFCLPKFRRAFREAALTRDHMPIYVSIFIGDRRLANKPLDKYSQAANQMFERGNRRPKIGEGFVSMSALEVITHVKC